MRAHGLRTARVMALLVPLVLLGGCLGSSNSRHFHLDMAPAGNPPESINIMVDRLIAADPLVRSEIMIQASSTEVRYHSDALWASSMSDMVRQKFAAEFGPIEPNRPTILLTGRIRNCGRLEENGNAFAHVRMDIAMRLQGTGRYADPLHHRTYEAKRPLTSTDPGDLVVELSRGIENIAEEIIEDAMQISLEAE